MSPGGDVRVAVLLSGRGSTCLGLHQAMSRGEVPARIVVVVTDKPKAAGAAKAEDLGIPAVAVSRRGLTREQHEERILEALRRHRDRKSVA